MMGGAFRGVRMCTGGGPQGATRAVIWWEVRVSEREICSGIRCVLLPKWEIAAPFIVGTLGAANGDWDQPFLAGAKPPACVQADTAASFPPCNGFLG